MLSQVQSQLCSTLQISWTPEKACRGVTRARSLIPHSFFPRPLNPVLSFDSWIPSFHFPEVPMSRAVLGAQPAPVTPVAFCGCLGCCLFLVLPDGRGQHIQTAHPAVSVGPDHNSPAAPRDQELQGWHCQRQNKVRHLFSTCHSG